MGKFTNFECPKCKEISRAGEWNSSTLKYATEQKKKMRTKIQDGGNTPLLSYICPKCGALSTKNTIRGRLASE